MEISIKPLENKAECKQVLSSMWFYSGIPCIDEVVYFVARVRNSRMEMTYGCRHCRHYRIPLCKWPVLAGVRRSTQRPRMRPYI